MTSFSLKTLAKLHSINILYFSADVVCSQLDKNSYDGHIDGTRIARDASGMYIKYLATTIISQTI